MAISSTKRKEWQSFSIQDQDRIVRMAWEDRTSFDAIHLQFELTANEVVKFMRTQLDAKSYKRWRKRATQRGKVKHAMNTDKNEIRFKCSRQRLDGSTKGWK